MRSLLALFVRALRQNTRAPSTYLLRGGIAAIVLFFLWSAHETFSWMGAAGLRFFSILVGVNFFLVALIGLGSFASAIAEEKEEGTLGLMRMADLSPVAILFGKSTSRFGIVFLLLLVQVPFAFLAVTLGGVSQAQVLTAFTLLVSFLFAIANVSLFFSVLLPRSSRAAIMTIALAIGYSLLCGGPYILSNWLIDKGHFEEDDPAIAALQSAGDWLWSVHPANHLGILASGGYFSVELARSVIVHVCVGIAFFILSILIFERCCGDEAKYSGESGRGANLWRWFGRPKRVRTHSIAWKDFHFSMGGRPSFALRLVGYVVFVVLIARSTGELGQRRVVAELAWRLGFLMLHFELAFLALLTWGPEAWGQHIGSLIVLPRGLRRITFEKVKAILIAVIPSVSLLVLAVVIGGSEFIKADIIPFFRPAYYSGAFRYSRLYTILGWYVGFAVLLLLIVNLSLRLKWTALPAALGLFALFQIVKQITSIWSFAAGGNQPEVIVLTGFLVVICFLIYNTRALLLRRAAEG